MLCYGYDIERKAELSKRKWIEEPKKVSAQCFLLLPGSCTTNKKYYLELIRLLRRAILRKRPNLLVYDWLTENNTILLPLPPYSPDLSPSEFFLQN